MVNTLCADLKKSLSNTQNYSEMIKRRLSQIAKLYANENGERDVVKLQDECKRLWQYSSIISWEAGLY